MPQYAQGMLEHIQNIVEYTVSILECTLRFLKAKVYPKCIGVYSKVKFEGTA